ncbi:MAG: hypothetical protein RJA70_450 [Pseudomonadota bacterium]|jgi:oligopeptide/dipeptide ABC transporter ATP-binding protein
MSALTPPAGNTPLLAVKNLTKYFPVTSGLMSRVTGQVRAVESVSFELMPGETLGLVGESGCGKSTLGRAILRLLEPTSGEVRFEGRDVLGMTPAAMRAQRQDMQIIFQDPYSSLNPRMRVLDIVGEALQVHRKLSGSEQEHKVAELLTRVGVPTSWINRYPHEFSGGQRQRIGIARALALNPKLIVCDEAVSALDVSIQAQVVNLLIDLREEFNLAYLFIAHDLSVVRHISHRVAVMYLGQIVELSASDELFEAPLHPYTRALLSAIPVADPRQRQPRVELFGDVPTPINPPSGCRFHTRCPARIARCSEQEPPLTTLRLGGDAATPQHQVKCFHTADALDALGDSPTREQLLAEVERRIQQATAHHASSAGANLESDRIPPAALAAQTSAPASFAQGRQAGRSAHASQNPAPSPEQERRRARGLGGALLAAGFITGGLGWWAPAPLVLLLGYWPFRPDLPSAAQRRTILALMFTCAVLVHLAGSHSRSVHQAEAQFAGLSAELESYRSHTGALPRSLDDLGWRLPPILDPRKLHDPWGQPWRYRSPGSDGRAYDLGSTGPDKKPGFDDLGVLPIVTPQPHDDEVGGPP